MTIDLIRLWNSNNCGVWRTPIAGGPGSTPGFYLATFNAPMDKRSKSSPFQGEERGFKSLWEYQINAGLAQLVELLVANQMVVGSNPIPCSKF